MDDTSAQYAGDEGDFDVVDAMTQLLADAARRVRKAMGLVALVVLLAFMALVLVPFFRVATVPPPGVWMRRLRSDRQDRTVQRLLKRPNRPMIPSFTADDFQHLHPAVN